MTVKPRVFSIFDAVWRCWHVSTVPGCFASHREAFDAAVEQVRKNVEVPC